MTEQSISDQNRLRAEWRRILHDCRQPLGPLARNSSPILLGLLLCVLCCAPSVQASALQLEAADGQPSLNGHLTWLLDHTGRLSFQEAVEQQRSGRFMPVDGDEVNLGFLPRSAVWIHFVLARDATAPVHWWLLTPPLDTLDYIDLCLERPDGTYEVRQGGRALPFAQRESYWRLPAFKLTLDTTGQRNVYLRVATITALRVPVWLGQERAFQRLQATDNFFVGGFFCVMAAAFLFSLFRVLQIPVDNRSVLCHVYLINEQMKHS